MINDYEFALATPCKEEHQFSWDGIYKYNNRMNKWTKFIEYSTNYQTSWQKIVFNENDNKLYTYDAEAQMTTFDINTKQININSNCCAPNVAGHCLVNANGEIHLIGGENNTKHLKWNNKTTSFECIYDFEQEYFGICFASAVYIKSKNIIILFGGFTNQWLEITLNHILIYSIDNNSWTKAKCVDGVKLWGMRSTVTIDDKYIIMCGGITNNNEDISDIWVLDILNNNEYKLEKSNICTPNKGCHHITRTGGYKDSILVFGYIRQLFKSFDLQMIPEYIMELISIWYSVEEIHWIERNGIDHFVISVKDILCSIEK